MEPEPNLNELYERLTAPFDQTHTDVRGGVQLEYITGEQCITRLNEVFGPLGWSFTIREHGINPEADEVWCLGMLTAWKPVSLMDGSGGRGSAVRQQFGSQKIKRSRSSGTPLDIGFDLKGAATDALKKCAMQLGIGLYLSKKEQPISQGDDQQAPAPQRATQGQLITSPGAITCSECGADLKPVTFQDGKTAVAADIARWGQRNFNRVLCMDHYRAAKRGELGLPRQTDEVPF